MSSSTIISFWWHQELRVSNQTRLIWFRIENSSWSQGLNHFPWGKSQFDGLCWFWIKETHPLTCKRVRCWIWGSCKWLHMWYHQLYRAMKSEIIAAENLAKTWTSFIQTTSLSLSLQHQRVSSPRVNAQSHTVVLAKFWTQTTNICSPYCVLNQQLSLIIKKKIRVNIRKIPVKLSHWFLDIKLATINVFQFQVH